MKYCIVTLFALAWSFTSVAQTSLKGSVQRIKVHSRNLEGNLAGDSPDRDVSIYLPPSYKKDAKRRYPVIYFLHGFTDNDAKWYGFEKHWINMPLIADSIFSAAAAKEMIIVTPNGFNRFEGSMYSNSVTTGNWEDFIAYELVNYMDAHYRTIAKASSRGLAGHSMGGYGSMRIGQNHPEVFSSLYLLSPCCLAPTSNIAYNQGIEKMIGSVKTFDDVKNADFFTKIIFACSAAWSPNAANPPLYIDLPSKDSAKQAMVEAKWSANKPLVTLHQHIPELKKIHAIAFDAGDKDEEIAHSIKLLDSTLKQYRIDHTYEEYEGDHVNRIAERIETKMLPFFSEKLSFDMK